MEPDDRLLGLLYEVVDEINQGRAPELTLGKSPTTVLMGAASKLDSLGIVNLIVTVEDKVQQTFGRRVNLFDVMFSGNKTQWTIADLAGQLVGQ